MREPRRQTVNRTTRERRDRVSSLNQTSAKIYQFPVGGRNGPERRVLASMEAASNPANILTSSSWYHEEAILEEQSSKRP
jgi:hypothetical protein